MTKFVNPNVEETDQADGWAGLLAQDEKILWQGRPNSRVKLEFSTPFEPVMFVMFTGFSIYWMNGASAAPGPFWMFGLIFLGVGLYNLCLKHFWKAHLRSRTHYTVTNHNIFIGSEVPFQGRKLETYPIRKIKKLDYRPGAPASLYFGNRLINGEKKTKVVAVGFEQIDECQHVFQLLQGLVAEGEEE